MLSNNRECLICSTLKLHSLSWQVYLFVGIDILIFLLIMTSILFTSIFLCPLTAFITLHITTPVKFAVTLPCFCVLMGVVAPPTTHKVTPVRTGRRPITLPSHSSQRTDGCVIITVIWRFLKENYVRSPRFGVTFFKAFQSQINWASVATPHHGYYCFGFLVFSKQMVAYFAEWG